MVVVAADKLYYLYLNVSKTIRKVRLMKKKKPSGAQDANMSQTMS